MIKVNVELDDDLLSRLKENLKGLANGLGAEVMPNTTRAFTESAKLIQKSWQNWALGGSIAGAEDIKNPNGKLASSIKIRRLGDFDAEIYTENPYMERIQNGSDEFDMKTKYPYGRKSRVAQTGKNKGTPFLIIPFRWGTPNDVGGERAHFGNAIPADLYAIASKFKTSKKTGGTHTEPNAKGEEIEREEYTWGDRLEADGNINGLVRMGSNPKSTYFTFRVISANSPAGSWIRKEVPVNNVVEALERNIRQSVNETIQAGLEQDLGL